MGRVDRLPGEETWARRFLELERRVMSAGAGAFGCSLTHTSATSVPSGVGTVMSWNTEGWDPSEMHDVSTNPTRITFPVPGYYAFGGSARLDTPSPSGGMNIYAQLNGSTIIEIDRRPGLAVNWLTVSSYFLFAAGDYIELYLGQESGSTRSTNATYDRFWAHRLA